MDTGNTFSFIYPVSLEGQGGKFYIYKKIKEINRVRSQSDLFLQKANLQKLPWKVIKLTMFARETFLIT